MSSPNNMRTQTFTYNGATVTVRKATVQDRLDVDLLLYTMGDTATVRDIYARRQFLRIVTQVTSIDGTIGFTLPSANASPADLNEAFALWREMDGDLYEAFKAALESVQAAVNDPDLTPDTGEKKEATLTLSPSGRAKNRKLMTS